MALIGRPYTKQISRSTLQNTIKKMTSYKGKRNIQAGEFKKICDDPSIKENKHMSRIAHNVYKNMRGKGVRDIKMKTHHAKQFMKVYGEAIKKAKAEDPSIKLTRFGRKKIVQAPKTGYRRVIKEEVDKGKPQGPTEEDLLMEKRRQKAKQNFNRYSRAKEIEKEEGRFSLHRGKDNEKKGVKAENKEIKAKGVPLTHGASAIETGFQDKPDSVALNSPLQKNQLDREKKVISPEKSKKKLSENEDKGDHFGYEDDDVDDTALSA